MFLSLSDCALNFVSEEFLVQPLVLQYFRYTRFCTWIPFLHNFYSCSNIVFTSHWIQDTTSEDKDNAGHFRRDFINTIQNKIRRLLKFCTQNQCTRAEFFVKCYLLLENLIQPIRHLTARQYFYQQFCCSAHRHWKWTTDNKQQYQLQVSLSMLSH